jgi:branched-chain amino acid transport system permease protein
LGRSGAVEAALQITVVGLLSGVQYALAAVGLTLIFATHRVFNMTQGAFFSLGAYAAYEATVLGYPAFAAAAPAAAAAVVFAAAVDRALVRPIQDSPLAATIMLFALAVLAEEGFLLIWGASTHSVPLRLPPLLVGRIVVSVEQIAAAVISAAIIAATALGLRTRLGLALRASAADPEIAAVAGIDVARLRTAAFGAGCAMATLAGTLLSPELIMTPTMGRLPLLFLLATVIAGEPGRIGGVVAASIAFGVLTSAAGFYLSPEWLSTVALCILIALLVWRINGVVAENAG